MYKQRVKFYKPIYVVFSVLDLSILLLYEFYYDKLNKYDPELHLLYTSTDSYFVEIQIDPYKIIKDHSEKFDASDYDKEHEWYNITNKEVIIKFKDELNGISLDEYCELRSKIYSYVFKNKNPCKYKGNKKV